MNCNLELRAKINTFLYSSYSTRAFTCQKGLDCLRIAVLFRSVRLVVWVQDVIQYSQVYLSLVLFFSVKFLIPFLHACPGFRQLAMLESFEKKNRSWKHTLMRLVCRIPDDWLRMAQFIVDSAFLEQVVLWSLRLQYEQARKIKPLSCVILSPLFQFLPPGFHLSSCSAIPFW